jgi:uncharacterized RDD family membrane protein YckC
MVPEDEIVVIQGHRVCAEGKAILLERLRSGETMPGELEKPTVLRRFGCMFLDGLIIGIPVAIITGVASAGSAAAGAANSGGAVVIGVVSFIGVALQIVYFGQMHGARGQTVGKIAGKLVVVNEDGSRISMPTAYLRSLAFKGPSLLSGIAIISGALVFVSVASLIAGLWGLIDIILALVDREGQRSLHDRIAGTRVVQRDDA